MDYEREPGSGFGGGSPDEPQAEQPADGAPAESPDDQALTSTQAGGPADAQAEAAPQSADEAEPAPAAASAVSDTDDEATHSDWPAADLNPTDEAPADEPEDTGDDSDAPVQMDDDDSYQTPPLPQNVQGETVNLKQGGVQSIKASNVTVNQGGAGRVSADTVSIEQGGVGMARAKSLTLGSGSSAFAVLADEAKIEDGASAMILVSRSFEGDVQPTIDWRTALAFGAGLGIALSIIRRLR